MMVSSANHADLDGLMGLADTFIDECTWDFDFNIGAAKAHFQLYLEHQDTEILVCKHDSQILGLVMVAASMEFHSLPLGYVSKFYVTPDGRGTPASKLLMAEMRSWFKKRSVCYTFATATAGLSQRDQRAFILMMKRSGFTEAGPVLVKEGL